jgi:hypothetical protein
LSSSVSSLLAVSLLLNYSSENIYLLFRKSIKYQRLCELPKLLSFEHLDVQFSIRSQRIRLIVYQSPTRFINPYVSRWIRSATRRYVNDASQVDYSRRLQPSYWFQM